MKQLCLLLSLLVCVAGFSQQQPPDLIYSCASNVNGKLQYELFNSSGQKIVKRPVEWAYSNTWSWLYIRDGNTKLVTAYNFQGRPWGIDSIEESQSTYTNLNRVGIKRSGKWGFYNKQGKLVIPHRYDAISHFKNNLAAVKAGNDFFMIDTAGLRVAVPYNPANNDYSFEDMDIALGMGGEFYRSDYKKIKENGKVGLLDVVNNSVIIPVEYDELADINDKFKVITGGKNGKYGLLAFGGKVVIPLKYERVFVLNAYF